MGVEFNNVGGVNPSSISLPEAIEVNEINQNECEFIFRNLEKGFGTTIGNAYRRTLISSVLGFAVTAIKIPGVKHEFDAVKGITEDMINLILNLKQMRVRRKEGCVEHCERIPVHVENCSKFTAKDFFKNSSCFEAVNDNVVIFHVDPSITLDLEIIIGEGFGFVISDQQKCLPEGEGFIALDSVFTPVKNVRFVIEEENLTENLSLFVTTDGEITPKKAVEDASQILVSVFSLLLGKCEEKNEQEEQESIFSVNDSVFNMHKLLMTPICNSNVNLSVRACNCLKSANISTLGDLVSKTEEELMELKNFGKKSLKELKALIESNNLKFGMDLSDFKIYKNK